MTIGELFAAIRKLQGIKQNSIAKADAVKVTQSAVAKLEMGKTSLGPDKMSEIARLLNINPQFIVEGTGNPFKGAGLIKMLLPESFSGGIDFWILHFLVQENTYLDILFLIAPLASYLRVLPRTYYSDPVYAIAARDSVGNLFLFRRKNGSPLFGEKELQLRLGEIEASYHSEVRIKVVAINAHLTHAIKAWEADREDIEPLFHSIEKPLILTPEEKEVVKAIRERHVDPKEILKILDTLGT